MATRNITVREFIDAIERNGYEGTRGDLFEIPYDFDTESTLFNNPLNLPENSKIIAACAYGQGLINLGISIDASQEPESGGPDIPPFWQFYKDVYTLNDDGGYDPKRVASELRRIWSDRLDIVFEFEEFDYSPFL